MSNTGTNPRERSQLLILLHKSSQSYGASLTIHTGVEVEFVDNVEFDFHASVCVDGLYTCTFQTTQSSKRAPP